MHTTVILQLVTYLPLIALEFIVSFTEFKLIRKLYQAMCHLQCRSPLVSLCWIRKILTLSSPGFKSLIQSVALTFTEWCLSFATLATKQRPTTHLFKKKLTWGLDRCRQHTTVTSSLSQTRWFPFFKTEKSKSWIFDWNKIVYLHQGD